MDTKIIDGVFAKFEAKFPGKWFSKFNGPHAQQSFNLARTEWAEALSGADANALKSGLAKCNDLRWPPTLGEFRAMCGLRSGDRAPEHREYAALPQPAVDPAIVSDAIATGTKAVAEKKGTRALYSSGYDRDEYNADLRAAHEAGTSFYDVDMRAMTKNGWSEELEENFRQHASILGWNVGAARPGGRNLYPRGHEPR